MVSSDNTNYDAILAEIRRIADEYEELRPELSARDRSELEEIKNNIINHSEISSHLWEIKNAVFIDPNRYKRSFQFKTVSFLLAILLMLTLCRYSDYFSPETQTQTHKPIFDSPHPVGLLGSDNLKKIGIENKKEDTLLDKWSDQFPDYLPKQRDSSRRSIQF